MEGRKTVFPTLGQLIIRVCGRFPIITIDWRSGRLFVSSYLKSIFISWINNVINSVLDNSNKVSSRISTLNSKYDLVHKSLEKNALWKTQTVVPSLGFLERSEEGTLFYAKSILNVQWHNAK